MAPQEFIGYQDLHRTGNEAATALRKLAEATAAAGESQASATIQSIMGQLRTIPILIYSAGVVAGNALPTPPTKGTKTKK